MVYIERMTESVITTVKTQLESINLATSTALDIVRVCMEAVENLKGLSGLEKSDVVIQLLQDQTILAALPEPLVEGIHVLMDANLLPATMAIICNAANGKFKLNKKSLLLCCSALLTHVFHKK